MTSSARQKKKVLIIAIVSIVVYFFFVVSQTVVFETEWKYEKYGNGYRLRYYKQAYDDDTTEIVIPSQYNGKDVVAIDDKAFYKNKKLKKVVIPDTVTEMGASVFKECKNLETVEIGENVRVIGGECFKKCKSLTEIVIPDSVTELRGESFVGCTSLKSVVLSENITEIRGNTFEDCTSLERIVIPYGVTRIGGHAFYGCKSLYYVFVPDTLREIGSSAFRKCDSLESIELPENVSINERAFKESPTRLLKKLITDDLHADIVREVVCKDSYESLYVIYEKNKSPDDILVLENTVFIVDSIKYNEIINSVYALEEFKEPEELADYLKEAKKKDAKFVEFQYYSEIASEKAGGVYFVTGTGNIDEVIEDFEKYGFSTVYEEVAIELSEIDPEIEIEPVYVLCEEVNGKIVPSVDLDCMVWFSAVPRGDKWKIVSTKKEILSHLKIAESIGAEKVMFALDNDIIGKSSGISGRTFDITEIIDGYTDETWTFDVAYELYFEEERIRNGG